jgi:hypothetical protein
MLVVIGLLGTAQGQTGSNPTGTWKWEQQGRGGQTRTSTLNLKLDGDKLTGSMLGRDDEQIAIKEATFKDNTIAFKVTRQFNDREFTQSFTGKLEGDTIKGTIKSERQDGPVEREWLAKRDANPAGTWTWEQQGRGGQTRTATLKLKLDAGKLTGAVVGRNDEETAITEATFKDNVIAFKVTRQFGDREVTQTYSGKLEGNTIKGTIKSVNRDGEEVEREWAAKRG